MPWYKFCFPIFVHPWLNNSAVLLVDLMLSTYKYATYVMFPRKFVSFQVVTYYRSSWVKKCYNNICPIISRYIATSVLLYVQGCNRKFYNTYVLSCLNIKRYVSYNTTKERYPSSLNLLYNMSDNTTQKKPATTSYPAVCMTSKENHVSKNTCNGKHQFLVMLPS